MGTSTNDELEAAKLLEKLIKESNDQPAELAIKLHMVCIIPFCSSIPQLPFSFSLFFSNFFFHGHYVGSFTDMRTLIIMFSDIATDENRWDRKHNAVPSDIKVKHCIYNMLYML